MEKLSGECQGQGLGKDSIMFAVYVAQEIRDMSGVVFVTLDCYQHRVSYYKQFGFTENLFQPIELEYDSPISMRLGIDEYLEKLNNEA